MSGVNPIPQGFHTITPYLVVDGAERAIEFYHRALGAETVDISRSPDGKVMNAQLRLGDSMFMLNDEFPDYGCVGPKKIGRTAVTLHVYVEDVDALWQRATEAGMEVVMPLENQFWGDHTGRSRTRSATPGRWPAGLAHQVRRRVARPRRRRLVNRQRYVSKRPGSCTGPGRSPLLIRGRLIPRL